MFKSTHLKTAIKSSRHTLPSIISSLDDDPSTQNCDKLINILAQSSVRASIIQINSSSDKQDSIYYNIYPGEHYRLLAGLISTTDPKCLVDIGTFTGMSSRIMLDYSSPDAEIHTFDIHAYDKFDSHLKSKDFNERNFVQHLDDLSRPSVFNKYAALLDKADLIFCDAPKDGSFEYEFLKLLSDAKLSEKSRLLLLDDIRFENMWMLWRSIGSPKIDATSFGHWSGTGIVDIQKSLIMNK